MWVDCANCPKVCGEMPFPCTKECEAGCGCPDGLFRKSRTDPTCVEEEDCEGKI